jgi:hypothetical protein
MRSNKQFEPTVIRRHVRAASAPFHYALAARWTAQRAAAQLRRYTARMTHRSGKSISPFRRDSRCNHRARPCILVLLPATETEPLRLGDAQ